VLKNQIQATDLALVMLLFSSMKTISCQDCEISLSSETREDILEQFLQHYIKEHQEILDTRSSEGKWAWMAEFERRWTA
jgi:hypothetical protein